MVLTLMISTVAFAENSKKECKLEDAMSEITSIEEFNVWENAEIEFDTTLYDFEGAKSRLLYSVINDNGIVGYMITDLKQDNIIEFALGESPYQELLDKKSNVNRLDKNKEKELVLINDNGSYYYSEDGFETLLRVVNNSNNRLDAVSKTKEENPNIGVKAVWKNVTIIGGVPDELNSGTTPGCGPVSAINLVKYWDANGFSSLVSSSDTKQDLYDELYDYMDSFPVFNEQVATFPALYVYGLEYYLYLNGGYDLITSQDVIVSISDFNKLKTEVNNDRPGTILYNNGTEDYGMHYVTFVGYCQDLMDDNYYIIHDLWSSTPTDVYKNWDYDVSVDDDVWMLYTFDIQ